MWISESYGGQGTDIYVTENGVDCPNESELTLPAVLNDTFRIAYHNQYWAAMADAVSGHGVNVRGYFVWSLIDNFEWVRQTY